MPDLYAVDVDEMTACALTVLEEVRGRLVARFGDEAGMVVDGYAAEIVADHTDEDEVAE